MEATGLSGTDALAVMNSRNGYGNDGFGCDGGWFWIIIILFAFWGNNGWGNNNGYNDIENRFLERDIFNTNQNVSNTASTTQNEILASSCQTQRDVLENRYTNQLGVQSIISSQKDCCCETNRNIDSVRYDNLLTAKDAQMQLSECCCRLEAGNLANTQKILDKLCENEIQQLRTDLQSAQLQISQLSQTANITNTLRPFPTPAYITCSPYESAMFGRYGFNNGCGNGCGCNNLI